MRLLGLLLAALLLSHVASAHTTVSAADDTLCLTVGHAKEPVTTYVRSGLDLTVRAKIDPAGDCSSNNRGDVVTGFQNAVGAAAIVAPTGQSMDLMPLQAQHGAPGSYTGSFPYMLTSPGQYTLEMEGEWEGHDISGVYKISGNVTSVEHSYFPPLPAGATVAELHERIDALEQQVASIQTEMQAMDARIESGTDGGMENSRQNAGNDSPPLATPLLVLAVGLVLLARRNTI